MVLNGLNPIECSYNILETFQPEHLILKSGYLKSTKVECYENKLNKFVPTGYVYAVIFMSSRFRSNSFISTVLTGNREQFFYGGAVHLFGR